MFWSPLQTRFSSDFTGNVFRYFRNSRWTVERRKTGKRFKIIGFQYTTAMNIWYTCSAIIMMCFSTNAPIFITLQRQLLSTKEVKGEGQDCFRVGKGGVTGLGKSKILWLMVTARYSVFNYFSTVVQFSRDVTAGCHSLFGFDRNGELRAFDGDPELQYRHHPVSSKFRLILLLEQLDWWNSEMILEEGYGKGGESRVSEGSFS